MSKHHAGPYRIFGEDEMQGWPFIRIECDDAHICEVQPTEETEEGFALCDADWATAHLLSAAPELLEALVQMGHAATDVFEQMAKGNWKDEHVHPVFSNTAMLALKDATKEAILAIAKAKGES